MATVKVLCYRWRIYAAFTVDIYTLIMGGFTDDYWEIWFWEVGCDVIHIYGREHHGDVNSWGLPLSI